MSTNLEPDSHVARKERFLLAVHRLGMSRLRHDPDRVFELLATLHRWRIQGAVSPSDRCFADWRNLLNGSLDALEAAVCDETQYASDLRHRTPFGSLMTETERQRLLREARITRTIADC
jgi:hypothetical protein